MHSPLLGSLSPLLVSNSKHYTIQQKTTPEAIQATGEQQQQELGITEESISAQFLLSCLGIYWKLQAPQVTDDVNSD